MSKATKRIRFKPGEVKEPLQPPSRDEELCNRETVREALLEIYRDIEKGFDKQADRSDDNIDYWEVYNCELGPRQFYSGNSKIFVPIVHSAVDARKTRFVNQMFPQSGRYVEVTTEDGEIPHAETALLEHYIRSAKIRTRIAPALVKNGDIEGHMTIQVTWEETKREVAYRTKKPITAEDLQVGEEVVDLLLGGIIVDRQRERGGEQMSGFEAGIDLEHFGEAAQEQASRDEEHHRHADLEDDHAAAQTGLAASVAGAVAAIANGLDQVRADAFEGGSESADEAGCAGEEDCGQQHWPAYADL